jgi:glutamyl-tRNA synthetase
MSTSVKTRFAPSPTGFLHVGGVRTALFAWLIARQNDGQFILRIEDTDQAREVAGSADHIQNCLSWLGLDWDGDVTYQSQRLELYKSFAQKLVDSGRAYADPYTPEQVQSFREEAQKNKQPFLYRNHRPQNPPAWDGAQPLRFKSEPADYQWHDSVMGDMHAGAEAIDDFVIIKSDGFPTYNFAHIIDDFDMGITHVIRGQEFVASTPNYLNLYEALGIERPVLASVPPIMNEQGNKKLSKRDGAKDILAYREEGFLPDAMINFLASLGWNDGTEKEEFTRAELIQAFSLERIQKSGARFDQRRLLWLNGVHIRTLPLDDLYAHVAPYWPASAQQAHVSDEYKRQVLSIIQERLKYFAELPELTNYFFEDLPVNPELISTHKQLKKLESAELQELLSTSLEALSASAFDAESLTATLNGLLETTGSKPAILLSLIRIAVSQSPASPGLADTLAVLGKETALRRISEQLKQL